MSLFHKNRCVIGNILGQQNSRSYKGVGPDLDTRHEDGVDAGADEIPQIGGVGMVSGDFSSALHPVGGLSIIETEGSTDGGRAQIGATAKDPPKFPVVITVRFGEH